MRRSSSFFIILGLALAAGLGSAVQAEVVVAADGVARFFCSDADGSPHPEEAVLTQNVLVPDFESLDNVQLALNYDPAGGGVSSRGTVRAVVRQLEADGSRPIIGTLAASQAAPDSEASAETTAASLEEGSTILWKVKFRKFEPLEKDQCFLVFTSVNLPLGEPAAAQGEEK